MYSIAKAIEINSGCTYVIESEHILSEKQKVRLEGYFKDRAPGSRFIILSGGLTIAKEEHVISEE